MPNPGAFFFIGFSRSLREWKDTERKRGEKKLLHCKNSPKAPVLRPVTRRAIRATFLTLFCSFVYITTTTVLLRILMAQILKTVLFRIRFWIMVGHRA